MTTIDIVIIVFYIAVLVAIEAIVIVYMFHSVLHYIRRRNFRNDIKFRRYSSANKSNRHKSKEN